MAARPARPCLHPGCPKVVRGKPRCGDHQRSQDRQRDQQRGSAAARGYDYRWQQISRAVITRDGGVCGYCGDVATTADHVVSKANGGTDDLDNLVASCVPCNSAKGGR